MNKVLLAGLCLLGLLLLSCGFDRLAVYGNTPPPYPQWEPNGLAVDRDGNLYVADSGEGAALIEVINSDGIHQADLGEKTRETTLALDVAIAENGDLWISIVSPPKVIRLDEKEKINRQILNPKVVFPESLDVDVQGKLWIVDSESNELFIADSDGNIIKELGKELGLNCPNDVSAAGSKMFVSDYGNSRILVVDLEGKPIREWKIEGSYPMRLAAQGEILAVAQMKQNDSGKSYELVRYRSDGGEIDRYPIELSSLDGMAVAPGGRIYLASAQSHKIVLMQ